MSFMFEKLDVYQRGLGFTKEVIMLTDKLPKGNYFLSDQLRRAALSISLNIAEGNGRWHKKDRKNFFIIARGSCFECVPILQLLKDIGCLDVLKYDKIRSDLEIIGKMVNALISALDKRKD